QTDSQHAKALLPARQQVLWVASKNSTIFPAAPELIFDGLQLRRDARPFPLSAMTRRRGIICRAKEEKIHTVNAAKFVDVPASHDRFNNWDDQHMFVGFLCVLCETLAPTGRPFRADAAHTCRGIIRIDHG